MNLSTQLRVILLVMGVVLCLGIYWWGRRKSASLEPRLIKPGRNEAPTPQAESLAEHPVFADGLDEDEFDTPAYLRRQMPREPDQYQPHIIDAPDYPAQSHSQAELVAVESSVTATHIESFYAEPIYVDARVEPQVEPAIDAALPSEPYLSDDVASSDEVEATTVVALERAVLLRPAPTIPVVVQPVATAAPRISEPLAAITPTLSEVVAPTAPPKVARPISAAAAPATRRKIIALRVPMPRVPGAQLLALLQQENLQHGKFNIFHRIHEQGTVFSVASMIEPGNFELAAMPQQQFPGVSLFMLLPGPLDGLIAYDQMLSCAQRLAHASGGELHDERGKPCTPQSLAQLREEVLDFQHLIGGA